MQTPRDYGLSGAWATQPGGNSNVPPEYSSHMTFPQPLGGHVDVALSQSGGVGPVSTETAYMMLPPQQPPN